MPPRYPIDELVRRHALAEGDADDEAVQEAQDAYGDAFGWVDHRSFESSVVEEFAWQLMEGDVLSFREDEEAELVLPIYNGVEHRVQLTHTGHDRYVMANSLAEILKDRYAVFAQKESWDGDTHAFLVLPHAQAAELEQRHGAWMRAQLERLPDGIDHFSGIRIPWHGHEDAAPDFAREHAEVNEALEQTRRFVKEEMFGGEGGGLLPIYFKQQFAAWGYLVCAAAWGVARLLGYGPKESWLWVLLFAAAAGFHFGVIRRIEGGYRPPQWVRLLPLGVLLLLAFTGVGQGAPPA
jgi:hypothetical protein